LLIAFATKTPAHQQYNIYICIGALRQNKKKAEKDRKTEIREQVFATAD